MAGERVATAGALVFGAVIGLSVTQAGAQTVEPDEAQAAREQKAREFQPHARSIVERALFKLEDDLLLQRWLDPPRGLYVRVGKMGEGAGFALGPAFRFNTPQYDVKTSAAGTLKGYFLGEASVRFPGTVGVKAPEPPPSVGWFESASFDPEEFKANYPNPAFINMQPDDAFWGARLVSRFSDDAIRAIVEQADDDDPEAVQYLVSTLIRRRDIVARTWLTRVNPIADVSLDATGALTFTNAAVAARVAKPATAYTIEWSRFDNESGATDRVAVEKQTDARGTAPAALLADAEYIAATIWSEHAEYPAWARPVHVYFRRHGAGWKTVGLYRDFAPVAPS